MARARLVLCLFTFVVVPRINASGQGMLVDIRPDHCVRMPRFRHAPPHATPPIEPTSEYAVESIDIDVQLTEQVAKVRLAQTFHNTGSEQLEVAFVFPLPHDGAVDQMMMLVDGAEFPARLLSANEARQLYESIIRKNKDPALLEWMGVGLFKTSVFPVPAGATRTVSLSYTQICRNSQGLTDFVVPLSASKYTARAIQTIDMRVSIDATSPIVNVYSPSHPVVIERPAGNRAVVSLVARDKVPTSDLRILYDCGDDPIGVSVISYRPDNEDDGYFVLFASPEIKANQTNTQNKDVIFVVDRSGSMNGKKMEQARGALTFVLNNLRDGDMFNIVAYDSEVETMYSEGVQPFDASSRAAAIGFVDGLRAGGSTNIEAALTRTMQLLGEKKRPSYVLFLTDGLPTAGETNEAKIVENASRANRARARVFAFGVGYDVNSRLLDKLARRNFGQSHFVPPADDIETAVSALYSRIEAPVLSDVAIRFSLKEHESDFPSLTNRVYPNETVDFFAGDQQIFVGRYTKGVDGIVSISGEHGEIRKSFNFPIQFVDASRDDTNAFVARLWATRRIGEIVDQLDLSGHNEELVQELVALSIKHGVLTPYTSFLADDTTTLHATGENTDRAGRNTQRTLSQTFGAEGGGGRAGKGQLQRATRAAASDGFAPPAIAIRGRDEKGGSQTSDSYEAIVAAAERDGAVRTETVQAIGDKTFFLRRGRWVDGELTPEEVKNAKIIARYSDAIFELADKHKDIGKFLAIDEPVVIKLGSEVYQW